MQEAKQLVFLGTISPPFRKTPSAPRTSHVEPRAGVSTEGLDYAYRQKCSRTNVTDTKRTKRSCIGQNWKMTATSPLFASTNWNTEALPSTTDWPTTYTHWTSLNGQWKYRLQRR